MALFTDGPIISTEDLQKCENSIFNLASIESIDLAGKIELAQDEIGNQIVLFFLRRLRQRDVVELPFAQRTRNVGDVVVTEPLRQWHVHKTLAMVYRDAYNNQLNDRYQGKWKEYEQLAKASSHNYFRIGVGVVTNPIGKASIPILSRNAGIGTGGTFYAAAAWINEAGQEGSLSNITETTTSDGELLVVSAVNPPTNAFGWNAYVGLSPESISLQNSVPVEVNSNWSMVLGLRQGVPPGKGQPATWFLMDNHVIQRG